MNTLQTANENTYGYLERDDIKIWRKTPTMALPPEERMARYLANEARKAAVKNGTV